MIGSGIHMHPTIYEDAVVRPDLFLWFGVVEEDFEPWLTALPLRVHPGLVSFWRRTSSQQLRSNGVARKKVSPAFINRDPRLPD
jgi:hypothetical protein